MVLSVLENNRWFKSYSTLNNSDINVGLYFRHLTSVICPSQEIDEIHALPIAQGLRPAVRTSITTASLTL